MSPLCESFLPADRLNDMEAFYPLHAMICSGCLLVQLPAFVTREHIFREYAYFSSFSETWLAHAEQYVETTIERFGLGPASHVVEVASNDGYLLQYFLRPAVPALGIEPARNVALTAREKGVPTISEFFGRDLARSVRDEHGAADLIVANNVLAQVPDLDDFVGGMKILLAEHGVVTIEFPHLLRLIEGNQFDTIYHEHFSYFSLYTAEIIFRKHGLWLFDVEELPTHGGSLRLFARHAEDGTRPISLRLQELRRREDSAGLTRLDGYASFAGKVEETKRKLLEFLIAARRAGKHVAGYGAPGKGNTLLNYCGIRTDLLEYTVDRNPYKHGKYLPGTHVPIHPPDRIRETQPDYVLILPWNFQEEIVRQMAFIRDWGGRFVVPIPEVRELP